MHDDVYSPRVIVLLDTDPRTLEVDWIRIDETVARITIAAYVVPYSRVEPSSLKGYNGKPLYGWEEPFPNTLETRARQYLTLYRLTGAEHVLCFRWPYQITGTLGDREFIHTFPHITDTFTHFTGKTLARFIHRAVHGVYPPRSTHT